MINNIIHLKEHGLKGIKRSDLDRLYSEEVIFEGCCLDFTGCFIEEGEYVGIIKFLYEFHMLLINVSTIQLDTLSALEEIYRKEYELDCGVYKHYKNNHYIIYGRVVVETKTNEYSNAPVLKVAHSETGEEYAINIIHGVPIIYEKENLILYQSINDNKLWLRPIHMFRETVICPETGNQKMRFELIEKRDGVEEIKKIVKTEIGRNMQKVYNIHK